MYRITLNNSGGELDSRTASTEEEAAQVAAAIILECGLLTDGDSITVSELEA